MGQDIRKKTHISRKINLSSKRTHNRISKILKVCNFKLKRLKYTRLGCNNKHVSTLPKQKNKSILYFDFLNSVTNRYAELSNKLYKAIAFLIYTNTLSLSTFIGRVLDIYFSIFVRVVTLFLCVLLLCFCACCYFVYFCVFCVCAIILFLLLVFFSLSTFISFKKSNVQPMLTEMISIL